MRLILLAITALAFSNCYAQGLNNSGKSTDELERLCNQNDGKACFDLNRRCTDLILIANAKKNQALVRDYFYKKINACQKACDLGVGDGCADMGHIVETANGKKTSDSMAWYVRGCDLNSSSACGDAGLYEKERSNYKAAKEYFEKNCQLNDSMGCFQLGTMYKDGTGVQQSYSTAKEYYRKSCEFGSPVACDKYTELNKQGY